MNGQLWTSIGALLIAIIGAGVGLRNGTKANRPAEMNAQLGWMQQAQNQAVEAREEAREAKAESAAARAESEQTRRQQVKLRREMDAMQDWVERVLRARDAYLADLEAASRSLEDSGVIRLMKAINGGPHIDSAD